MIRLESVSKSYPNGVLFNNVNISINKGMRVGLVGKNGSGKSTLLKLILKEERPDTGSIQIQKALKLVIYLKMLLRRLSYRLWRR